MLSGAQYRNKNRVQNIQKEKMAGSMDKYVHMPENKHVGSRSHGRIGRKTSVLKP